MIKLGATDSLGSMLMFDCEADFLFLMNSGGKLVSRLYDENTKEDSTEEWRLERKSYKSNTGLCLDNYLDLANHLDNNNCYELKVYKDGEPEILIGVE